ncbi:MAG: baseplate J/gp47 family protein [Euryarchaeota archaeon]|nr:baseplate J/gp47 family protein [Euryarchaeota archaeon]
MSLPLPNLDDRNFDDLMKEARSLIPVYNKEWTNYNPSDPGITMLELFSWLSEMSIYRINKVQEENYRKFLKLLDIEYLFRWNEIPGEDMNDLIDFFIETYGFNWIKIAQIEKIDGGRTARIYIENEFENKSILLKLNDKDDKVTIILDNGGTHDLNVKKELWIYENQKSDYLFRWDNVPGSDKDRLITFLTQRDNESLWIKNANLEKTDDGRTIKFFNETQFILLQLIVEDNKVLLYMGTTSGIREKKYEFDVIKDLKIYETIEFDIRRGLESISQRYRAITSDDFEFLANQCIETLQKGLSGRAIYVNNRDLEYGKVTSEETQPGHVSVIIIPGIEKPVFSWDDIPGNDNIRLIEFLAQTCGGEWIKTARIEKSGGNIIKIFEVTGIAPAPESARSISLKLNATQDKVILESPFYISYEFSLKKEKGKLNVYCYTVDGKPSELLKDQVKKYLAKRKLVTTRLHIVGPDYYKVTLDVYISLKDNTLEKTVIDDLEKSIREYYDPLAGGREGKGWPLGRDLYRSEIYQLIESIQGVDHVEKIEITSSNVESVELEEYQLIWLDQNAIKIKVHYE